MKLQGNVLNLDCQQAVEFFDLQAAQNGEATPRFKMRAYTGGAMRVNGFHRPVVVDLTGLKSIGKQVPIFRQHDPEKIVGHGEVRITDKEIHVEGLISADNEYSRDVVKSSLKGFPWQASIGASVEEMESIKPQQKVKVNGRTIQGPMFIARKSLLGEISFVPLGADRQTSATVTATQPENFDVEFADWLAGYGLAHAQTTPKLRILLRLARHAERTGDWLG